MENKGNFLQDYEVIVHTEKLHRIEEFWKQHSEWSQATFGTDKERGPVGALKHLEKEAREAQTKPEDFEEYADCLFLIFDAARRAGLTLNTLLDITFMKLEKNKQRRWVKPTNPDEPIEHERGFHD